MRQPSISQDEYKKILEVLKPQPALYEKAEKYYQEHADSLNAHELAVTLLNLQVKLFYNSFQLLFNLLKRAAQSNPKAAFNDMGILYLSAYQTNYGHTPEVLQSAADCFKYAASLGNVKAQSNLASVLLMNEEYNEALANLSVPLAMRIPKANLMLGDMYFNGLGMESNPDAAIQIYKKSFAEALEKKDLDMIYILAGRIIDYCLMMQPSKDYTDFARKVLNKAYSFYDEDKFENRMKIIFLKDCEKKIETVENANDFLQEHVWKEVHHEQRTH